MHEAEAERNGVSITPAAARRFWARIDKTSDTGCWLWTGYRRYDGYGLVTLPWADKRLPGGGPKTKAFVAHRFAWRLHHGDWPAEFNADGKKLVVMHSCDVRHCVAPHHMSLGTNAENSADMAAKGRASQGDNHYSRVEPHRLARGSGVGTSKLTEAQVAVIKAELVLAAQTHVTGAPKRGTGARLAEHFGVTREMIWQIAQGRQWAHVEPAVITESILTGKIFKGASNAKHAPAQIAMIKRALLDGVRGAVLAKQYGVSETNISAIKHGKLWPEIEPAPPAPPPAAPPQDRTSDVASLPLTG